MKLNFSTVIPRSSPRNDGLRKKQLPAIWLVFALLFAQTVFSVHDVVHAKQLDHDHCSLAAYAPIHSALVSSVVVVKLPEILTVIFTIKEIFWILSDVPAYFSIRAPPTLY